MAGSRMVMCWLFVQFVELYCVKSAPERFAIKQLELAERRYQTSVRTFVMAKRLDLQLQQFSGEN